MTFEQWQRFNPGLKKLMQFREAVANTSACPSSALIECIGGPWVECKECHGRRGKLIVELGGFVDCSTCHGGGRVPQPTTLCGKVRHVDNMHRNCPACHRILAWRTGQQKCKRCKGEGGCIQPVGALGPVAIQCRDCFGSGHVATIGLVQSMAQQIYDERQWEDMPILADVLQEAGCTNTAILEHLRADGGECPVCKGDEWLNPFNVVPGRSIHQCNKGRLPAVHAKGCWVLDLILGKT